ncbi:MAG: hypothetical protein RBR97_19905 [Bacteroidales bacterium]|nr:hypothetical protein [Bacteroidales bacterium]
MNFCVLWKERSNDYFPSLKCPVFLLINWTNILFLWKTDKMKTSEYIAFTIDRLPNGYVFTYVDFATEVNPITKYKLAGVANLFSFTEKWNIG